MDRLRTTILFITFITGTSVLLFEFLWFIQCCSINLLLADVWFVSFDISTLIA
jgi:hypothetical protein